METILSWWQSESDLFKVLFITGCATLLIQVLFHLLIYIRLSLWRHQPEPTQVDPISIVICAKNEEKRLRDLIPKLMEQDHPQFEIVVVDDSSWDDTITTLRAYQVRYSNLHVIHLDEDIQRMRGKKFALTVGIKGAKYDNVLLTDADCWPTSDSWARRMCAPFNDPSTSVVLGFSPYRKLDGFLNRVIRFDAAQIGVQYLSFALRGIPYMGVGRNLAYRKSLFFENSGFKSHLSIASGDDDLFISEVASRKNTTIVAHPEAQMISEPKESWSSWFKQKRRHFTTAPYYKGYVKALLGLWPLSFVLFWTSVLLLAVLHNTLLIAGSLLLVRYIIHLATFRSSFKKTGQTDLAIWIPILEGTLWIISPTLWLWNLLSKPRTWK